MQWRVFPPHPSWDRLRIHQDPDHNKAGAEAKWINEFKICVGKKKKNQNCNVTDSGTFKKLTPKEKNDRHTIYIHRDWVFLQPSQHSIHTNKFTVCTFEFLDSTPLTSLCLTLQPASNQLKNNYWLFQKKKKNLFLLSSCQ